MARRKLNQHLGRLIEDLDSGKINPEVLTSRLRQQIVFFIKRIDSTRPNSHIAKIVGWSDAQVGRVFKSGLRKMTPDINGEIQDLVNLTWMKSNEYQRRAIAAGEPRQAWQIYKETVETLQSLGFVFEAPKRVMLANLNVNAGPSPAEVEKMFERYFDEHGVVRLAELAAALGNGNNGGNGNGNGHGNGGRRALPAPVIPASLVPPTVASATATPQPDPGAVSPDGQKRGAGETEEDEPQDR